jgi:16S rRNA (guanine527-N7)-methyltransferase
MTASPVEPVGAVAALFGDQVEIARGFCGHLATSAVERGLIGPREVPRLWERHILNCAAVAERISMGSSVIDVGSGAGLPGVALAIARPDLRVLLVEPLQRRVAWLEEVIGDLGLVNVEVARSRAEELRPRAHADAVTARAVAALPLLARLCLPLVRPGGRFLAVKGRSAEEELCVAGPDLMKLGASGWAVHRCGVAALKEPTTVVEIIAGGGGGGERGRNRCRNSGGRRRRPG